MSGPDWLNICSDSLLTKMITKLVEWRKISDNNIIKASKDIVEKEVENMENVVALNEKWRYGQCSKWRFDLSIVKAEDKVPSVIKPNAAAATPDCFKMTKVLDDRK